MSTQPDSPTIRLKNLIGSNVPFSMFIGDDIAARLKVILALMDHAAQRAEGGHPDMHDLNRAAREELHDLLAEVSE